MRVEFVMNLDEHNEDVILSKEFPNCHSKWDKEISDWSYEKLLELDAIYDFSNYEECPAIDEIIYDDKGKIVKIESCIESYFSL